MLKIISLITLLTLSSNLFAHEYEVEISDTVTGETQIEKCANENELNVVANDLINLNNNGIEFTVRKMNSITTDTVKSGGEGGGD